MENMFGPWFGYGGEEDLAFRERETGRVPALQAERRNAVMEAKNGAGRSSGDKTKEEEERIRENGQLTLGGAK